MLKLDNNLLDELGLGGLPEEQKRAMLQHVYDTLELRVGTNLANQMTDQQLEEFEKFIDDGGDANQAQALQWLETNLPNYKQVVNEVFEALKAEIRQMAPQIMASSAPQQPAGMNAAYPQAPPQPMMPQQQHMAANGPYQQPMPAQGQPAQTYAAPAAAQSPVFQSPQMPAYQASDQSQPMPAAQQQPYVRPSQQPVQDPQQPAQPQQDAQTYQFPTQQPPAGPGGYQSPQQPGGRQAA